ncbi:unnamed protein product, partial [Phaeothamnion confervicola]
IRDRFRQLARQTHPDAIMGATNRRVGSGGAAGSDDGGGLGGEGGNSKEGGLIAESVDFERIRAAYEVLSDAGRRSTYDQGVAMKRWVSNVKSGDWKGTLSGVVRGVGGVTRSAVPLGRRVVEVTAAGIGSVISDLDAAAEDLTALSLAAAAAA